MSNTQDKRILIDVAHIEQEEGDECVIACCVMLLDWARNRFGKDVPKMPYATVKSLMKKEAGGLPLNATKALNDCKQLKKAKPRIRFGYSIGNNLNDVLIELEKDYPVIAWIELTRFGLKYVHSVVVNGISVDKMSIDYIDPDPEATTYPLKMPTSEFLEHWECTLNALIRIDIVEDPILLLPDYFDEEVESKEE